MKKILIVEDDTAMATLLKERLIGAGFEVLLAVDAYQGLMTAKNETPDLIILDCMLPAGGGESMLTNLKGLIQTRRIPVLILTASLDPELKERMLAGGVAGYMEKPYEAAELIETINTILILQKKR